MLSVGKQLLPGTGFKCCRWRLRDGQDNLTTVLGRGCSQIDGLCVLKDRNIVIVGPWQLVGFAVLL